MVSAWRPLPLIVLPTITPQISPPLPPPLRVMSACGQYRVKYALPLPLSVTDCPAGPVHMMRTFEGSSESLLSAPLPLNEMLPDTYTTTGPWGLAVLNSTEPLPFLEIEVAENEPGPMMVWLPIAPSWLATGIAGMVGIG